MYSSMGYSLKRLLTGVLLAGDIAGTSDGRRWNAIGEDSGQLRQQDQLRMVFE